MTVNRLDRHMSQSRLLLGESLSDYGSCGPLHLQCALS